MRTRSLPLVAIATCAIVALLTAANPVAAAGKKSGPMVVAKDPVGDWGDNAGGGMAPLGDALGQEIVEASIGMADAKTVNFIIKLNSLPPWGGVPESSRYNWDFMVDGTAFQLTGGYTEFLRGTCNPLHTNDCPPPHATEPQTFFLRQGPCTVGAECVVLERVIATFDPAEATITIPVSLKSIKGKPGSKIGPAASSLGGGIYAALAAMVSYASLPNDTVNVTGTYVVPKG